MVEQREPVRKLARILPDIGRAGKSLLERENCEDGTRRFVARKQFKSLHHTTP